MIDNFPEILAVFFLYSFAGWIFESIYCSIKDKRFVSRGLLKGPYCPIYGLGALAILLISTPLKDYPIAVFFISVLVASILEYLSSALMEGVFKMRWWDYSKRKFHLHGRIWLPFSLIFGALGLAIVYLAQPKVEQLLIIISLKYLRVAVNIVFALFFFDFIVTLRAILGLSKNLQDLQKELSELLSYQHHSPWLNTQDWTGSLQKLHSSLAEDTANQKSQEVLAKVDSISRKMLEVKNHLLRYPQLKTHEWEDAVKALRSGSKQQIKALAAQVIDLPAIEQFIAKNTGAGTGAEATADTSMSIASATTAYPTAAIPQKKKFSFNSIITAIKSYCEAIIERSSYTNLFWVFLIGCVIGYVVETLYCLVANGYIESRQGMLHGPFNQIYGLGAAVMVIFLEPLRQKSDRWLFVGGAIVGGVFEILCSLVQEFLFGSVSWDYTNNRFSIAGGRTSLFYMFFWGILCLFFMKGIYPGMLKLISLIPKKLKAGLTIIFTLFFAVNIVLSSAAVYRWSQRLDGLEPSNAIERYLDKQYPDAVLQEVYPNMHFRN